MRRYPQRVNSHSLETESERFFITKLPNKWTSEKQINDYGVDLRVKISDSSNNFLGFEFLVQLKSSNQPSSGNKEKVRLKVSTYNYLWDKLQVVILVKYIRSKKQAYWILLSDVPEPNQKQQTFTVKIPRSNTLTTIKWNSIYQYIQDITYKKLSIRERGQFNRYVR